MHFLFDKFPAGAYDIIIKAINVLNCILSDRAIRPVQNYRNTGRKKSFSDKQLQG